MRINLDACRPPGGAHSAGIRHPREAGGGRGPVKTRGHLLEEVCEREYEVFDRAVDVQVSNLRRKWATNRRILASCARCVRQATCLWARTRVPEGVSAHSTSQRCRRLTWAAKSGSRSPGVWPDEDSARRTSSIQRATASGSPGANKPALPRVCRRQAMAPSVSPTKRMGRGSRSKSANLLGQSKPRVSGRCVTTNTRAARRVGSRPSLGA